VIKMADKFAREKLAGPRIKNISHQPHFRPSDLFKSAKSGRLILVQKWFACNSLFVVCNINLHFFLSQKIGILLFANGTKIPESNIFLCICNIFISVTLL
jgi:hypothetical protein